MKRRLTRCVVLTALCATSLPAQNPDTTILKQVIIFGRHGVRTPVVPNSTLNTFSTLPFPTFAASGQAVLTPNGQTNETLLGGYFRLWLTQENLLTDNDASDAAFFNPRGRVSLSSGRLTSPRPWTSFATRLL